MPYRRAALATLHFLGAVFLFCMILRAAPVSARTARAAGVMLTGQVAPFDNAAEMAEGSVTVRAVVPLSAEYAFTIAKNSVFSIASIDRIGNGNDEEVDLSLAVRAVGDQPLAGHTVAVAVRGSGISRDMTVTTDRQGRVSLRLTFTSRQNGPVFVTGTDMTYPNQPIGLFSVGRLFINLPKAPSNNLSNNPSNDPSKTAVYQQVEIACRSEESLNLHLLHPAEARGIIKERSYGRFYLSISLAGSFDGIGRNRDGPFYGSGTDPGGDRH